MKKKINEHLYRYCFNKTRNVASKEDALKSGGGGYYSQYGQDRYIVEEIFGKKRNGVFVDIGANDGVKFSNTYHMEKVLGWTGLVIEPLPDVYKTLKVNRNCIAVNGCISDKEGEKQFLALDGYAEMLSGLVDKYQKEHLERIDRELKQYGGSRRTISVPCYRLKTLLDQHGMTKIDYLSIDTEGGELDILKSIDLKRIDISVISVENNYKSCRLPFHLMLNGYQWVACAGDEIYLKK